MKYTPYAGVIIAVAVATQATVFQKLASWLDPKVKPQVATSAKKRVITEMKKM